jgi:hypothetical protein
MMQMSMQIRTRTGEIKAYIGIFVQQPTAPAVTTPARKIGVGGQGTLSKHTYYNNWNMHTSYGFDLLFWLTNKACPATCRTPNHHKGCDYINYLKYQATG